MQNFHEKSQEYSHAVSHAVSPTFFGQVMSLFALALGSSAVGAYIGLHYLLPTIIQKPGLMYLVFGAELILIFTSQLWKNIRGWGNILFVLFTLLSGLSIAPLLAFVEAQHGAVIVYKALAATGMTFVASGLIGWRTNWNLMGLRGFLMFSLIGMLIVSIIGIFVPWGSTFEMVFSGFGVILFSAYAMVDFQRIKYSEGHPMDAALQIYLDIFNLFTFILRLMIAMRRN